MLALYNLERGIETDLKPKPLWCAEHVVSVEGLPGVGDIEMMGDWMGKKKGCSRPCKMDSNMRG